MPEWLTRKVGPLPVWGYALGGVVLVFLYRRGKSSSKASSSGSSANYSATVPNVPTESVTTPSGFSYSGPAGGGQYYIPQGAMSATSGSSTNSGAAAQQQFIPLTAGQAYNLTQTGQPGQNVFYQSAPGIFSSIPLSAFTPTSGFGPAYLQAPPGYTAPAGTTPVSGVIGGTQ